jgi:hypothetical protein
MIPRHPFACAGRDQGIQLYNQLMIEWQEHLLENPVENSPEKEAIKPSEPDPGNNFIKDALSIFNPASKPSS